MSIPALPTDQTSTKTPAICSYSINLVFFVGTTNLGSLLVKFCWKLALISQLHGFWKCWSVSGQFQLSCVSAGWNWAWYLTKLLICQLNIAVVSIQRGMLLLAGGQKGPNQLFFRFYASSCKSGPFLRKKGTQIHPYLTVEKLFTMLTVVVKIALIRIFTSVFLGVWSQPEAKKIVLEPLTLLSSRFLRWIEEMYFLISKRAQTFHILKCGDGHRRSISSARSLAKRCCGSIN